MVMVSVGMGRIEREGKENIKSGSGDFVDISIQNGKNKGVIEFNGGERGFRNNNQRCDEGMVGQTALYKGIMWCELWENISNASSPSSSSSILSFVLNL
jgi:hypothetical protein